MSFGDNLVGHALDGAGLPSHAIQHGCALFLAVMMVAFPITFRHGIVAYAQREARELTKVIEQAVPKAHTADPSTRAGSGMDVVVHRS